MTIRFDQADAIMDKLRAFCREHSIAITVQEHGMASVLDADKSEIVRFLAVTSTRAIYQPGEIATTERKPC